VTVQIAVAPAAVLLVGSAGPAPAADRLILGRSLLIRAMKHRSIVAMGKEATTDVPGFSDPRMGGATLTVIANGGTGTSQSYALDGQLTCCIPAGGGCSDGASCCSGSCNGTSSTCD